MKTRASKSRSVAGWMLIDVSVAMFLLVVAFWATAHFAVQERGMTDALRSRAAVENLLTAELERVRGQPFSALQVEKDQPLGLEAYDARLLRDVTAVLDVERYRPDAPDLLKVTVRVVWRTGPATSIVRSRSILLARRDYEEGR